LNAFADVISKGLARVKAARSANAVAVEQANQYM
jgi:hypothetical protein